MFLKKNPLLFLLFFFSWIISLTTWAFQSEVDEANPFSVWYDEGPVKVLPGEDYSFSVIFQIPDKFYLYEESIEIEVVEALGIQVQEIEKEKPEKKHDPFLNKVVPVYYHEADVELRLKMPDKPWDGELTISGDIQYQGCSDKLCYRVMHLPFQSSFSYKPAAITQNRHELPGNRVPVQKSFFAKIKELVKEGDFNKIVDEGLWFTMFLAFLGGLLTNFTPCVWPMIPLTLAHIGVRKGETIWHNLAAVFVLILGMAVMYSLLGVTAALLGKGLGFLFQNIGFLILLDIILFAMAFSFLGFFEFHLPQAFVSRVSRISAKGYAGDFLVGLTMGIMAAPCVGPVVGPLLAFVAQTKNVVIGFWLLASYALGIGSLFLLLGALYGVVPIRFRSGRWTLWFERALGIVLLVVGLYYARVIYSEVRGSSVVDRKQWITSLDEALNKSRMENKPVVVDFFAQWCAPCLELDKEVWNNPSVMEKLADDWVSVKIDCTQETSACQSAVDRFHIVGWPTILFLNTNQEEVNKERLVGRVVEPEELLLILERIENP